MSACPQYFASWTAPYITVNSCNSSVKSSKLDIMLLNLFDIF